MKIVFLFLLFLNSALLGCADPDIPCQSFSLTEPTEISIGERIQHCEEPVAVTFQQVTQDSRCPTNVSCVWQGIVEIELVIEVAEATESFLLSSYPPYQNVPGQVDFKGYRINFLDAFPYPHSTQKIQPEDYQVILLLEKLPD